MGLLRLAELYHDFKDVLENDDLYAIASWYERGPTPLGNARPLTEQEIREGSDGITEGELLKNAMKNADAIPHILEAINGIGKPQYLPDNEPSTELPCSNESYSHD